MDYSLKQLEQRRRTIGAMENVVLPGRGLRPSPNPITMDLPELSLTASVTGKKVLSHLNVNTDADIAATLRRLRGGGRASALLSTSVPAPDVHVRVAWNRHVNEGLHLEDLDENVLESVVENQYLSDENDDKDMDEDSTSDGGWSDQEVVTRDETNLARHFKKKYRFNEEVAVPVGAEKQDPPDLDAGSCDFSLSSKNQGATASTCTATSGGDNVPRFDESEEIEAGSFGSFVASPVLHFALEQTRLAASYTPLCQDQNIDLPEAAWDEECDFEVREEEEESDKGAGSEFVDKNPFEEEVVLEDL
eukprot:GHVN01056143.1.p1 GENE.GHVN01056143.1~~GHVN01056143.1.p1  ORF type:complete len:305 (+),score=62.55 GHVN01056143.1:632-1546(+)